MRSFLPYLVAILVFIVAIAVEIFTIGTFLKAKEAENWPTTTGKITRSEFSTKAPIAATHYAEIEYQYTVGQRFLKSTHVRTRGVSSKKKEEVAAVIEKYNVGKEVQVHYNPDDVTDAYLEVGVDFVSYLIIVTPLIFAVGAVAFMVERFRRGRVPPPDLVDK